MGGKGAKKCKILLEKCAEAVYEYECLFDVPVAQLDRVSASDAEGRGFESLRVRHKTKEAVYRPLLFYVE